MTTSSQGVVVLGSTGSIGTSTLDVIAALKDHFHVVGLSAGGNVTLLQEQVDRFGARYASCSNDGVYLRDVRVVDGEERLVTMATLEEADIVVVATTGHEAILPTLAALRSGKIVALANKESIVAAGAIVMPVARQHPGHLRPVDSEHSALWQCLGGQLTIDHEQVHKLVLTASGGPFRGWQRGQLATVTPQQALRHPNWEMGAKVTIDSATLMNKGLEVIEAMWLFDCPLDRIDVVVHPQSLVHSCIEFADGSIMAQIASHDMRIPIQYALTFPEHVTGPGTRLGVLDLARLDFEAPDHDAFPLLNLARESARRGGTFPTVLSAADSVAVDAFLRGHIPFVGIDALVHDVLDLHSPASAAVTIEAILETDAWAQDAARTWVRVHAND
jgi:1-deoxy-D-xylulose-5-phosphate reductoisomerase